MAVHVRGLCESKYWFSEFRWIDFYRFWMELTEKFRGSYPLVFILIIMAQQRQLTEKLQLFAALFLLNLTFLTGEQDIGVTGTCVQLK